MTNEDSLQKRLDEARRLREQNRERLESSDLLIERINLKLAQVQKLRQARQKKEDGQAN